MTRTADISIWDAASRAVLVQSITVALPLEIGRVGSDARGRLRDANGRETVFGQGLDTMSRSHMKVVPSPGGGAEVIDESSNGIARVVPGQPPMPLGRNRREELQPGASRQFETVGLVIEVALPRLSRILGAATLFASWVSRSTGAERALPIGTRCLALRDVGGEVQLEQAAEARVADVLAAMPEGAGLAAIGPDSGGRVVVLPGRDGAVICNRRALPAGVPQALEHLDTVEIGPVTLRIMAEGAGPALVCINPQCRQMNPYLPGGNCRYCGTRLGDATTRMLPQEGRA